MAAILISSYQTSYSWVGEQLSGPIFGDREAANKSST